MADNTVMTPARALESVIQSVTAGLRVAQPGVIGSFDAGSQRVTAQPSCKMQTRIDGQTQHIDLPPVTNVPIAVPYAQGAGLVITLPIQGGDPCMMVFADRAIDNVLSQGGAQPPVIVPESSTAIPRTHSLTDAMCIPGLVTDAAVVPDWSTMNIEIRDMARKNYVSVGPNGVEVSDGVATLKISNGAVEIVAPAGVKINGIAFEKHRHVNVQTGTGTSGGPV